MKNQPSDILREKLDKIEFHIQTLIEGSTSQKIHKSNLRKSLAHGLVEAMRNHLTTWEDGRISAPHQYRIFINPSQGKTWIPDQYLLDELAEVIKDAGHSAGINFLATPDLRVIADYNLSVDEFRIELPSSERATSKTTYLSKTTLPKGTKRTKELHLAEAYLIINAKENVYLKQPVINIGRSSTNHIIIDDPRVSRSHAQLRQIKGQYVLFDLSSKGGTFVNGTRVSQTTLNSGDVISLAGIAVIYVNDPSENGTNTETVRINLSERSNDQGESSLKSSSDGSKE